MSEKRFVIYDGNIVMLLKKVIIMSDGRFEIDVDHLLRIWDTESNKRLTVEEVVDLLNELATKCSQLKKENEQLKIANARWLDKSLQDKQIRYDNTTCKELTRKYLQLKDENEQLKKELLKIKKTVSSIQKQINNYYNEVCSNE